MFFVQKRYTFAFKNYSWEFQTALLLLNVHHLWWIFRPANTNQIRSFRQSLTWMPETFYEQFPGFGQFSERCAHICIAPSQNSIVWRPNIHVWTHFEPIFSLRVHGWIQTTVSQLAGVWMSPEETVVVFVQCFYTDVVKISISNFRRLGTAFFGELPQARTVLLFGSYSGQIFSRRNLLTRRRK